MCKPSSTWFLAYIFIGLISLTSCNDKLISPHSSTNGLSVLMQAAVPISSVVSSNIGAQKTTLFKEVAKNLNYAFTSLQIVSSRTWLVVSVKQTAFGDFTSAVLVSKRSLDGGKTWGPEILVQDNIGKVNITSPSLVQTDAKTLFLFFLVKNSETDTKMYFKKSSDGGMTWNIPVSIPINIKGYYVCNNDRVILTSKKRLIIPLAFAPSIWINYIQQNVKCLLSDDLGKTWHVSSTISSTRSPLMEPGVEELSDGSILMVIRSQTGYVLFSTSKDGGNSWSNLVYSSLQTPEAPQTIRRIPGTDSLIMAFINTPYIAAVNFNNRQPLALALSTDNGKTWPRIVNIEGGTANYLYPSLTFLGSQMILTYAINPGGENHPYMAILNLRRDVFFPRH